MAHIRTATASNDNISIEIRRQARRVTAIWTRMEAATDSTRSSAESAAARKRNRPR
jgi:hypothetical protein